MLSKLLISLFLCGSLYATSIITEYRKNGIGNIEKQMDLELTNITYWLQTLQDIDTSFGYIESYNSILTCDKENSTLKLHQLNKKKKFTLAQEYSAYTGEVKGDKQREGDLKTPLGIYDITKKISKLDSFYGPLAFVSSYPNTFDKYQGKSGSGIWIHGLPTEQKRDDYTKGCIAINNDNIIYLDKKIDIDSTLLIINPTDEIQRTSKEKLSKLLAGLYAWRYSWIYNDTKKYLSFYSQDFIRHDGMNYNNFAKYKTRIFAKDEKKKIIFSNINILPYPNTTDTFQITFKEFYTSDSFTFEGNKVLMVKIDKDNHFYIFTEK